MSETPEIQLIANLVVQREDGHILLARYNPDNESDADDADIRWWLPAQELEPYQHPDEAAEHAIGSIGGVTIDSIGLSRVQSFRGRRGWHVSFDYDVSASGEPTSGVSAAWFDPNDLPATMHGNWEKDTIAAVVNGRNA